MLPWVESEAESGSGGAICTHAQPRSQQINAADGIHVSNSLAFREVKVG